MPCRAAAPRWFAPTIAAAAGLDAHWLEHGPFGQRWLVAAKLQGRLGRSLGCPAVQPGAICTGLTRVGGIFPRGSWRARRRDGHVLRVAAAPPPRRRNAAPTMAPSLPEQER